MTHPHDIEVRDLRFPLPSEMPRYWHGGRRAVTIFFNNLSVFFPEGERFFINAVKAQAQFAQGNQALQVAIRAFCQQEGYHSREHVRYNQALAQLGYPISAMEGRVQRLLRGVRRRAPLRRQLAITCALEHFTALLGHVILKDPRILDGALPVMAGLWRWHAAEENEHKAVAFDLYQAAGGRYRERILIMLAATVIFWVKIIEHQMRMMAADGLLYAGREWFSLLSFLFVRPGGMLGLMRHYFDYFRPNFHPWDLDNSALLAKFRQEQMA